MQQIAIIGNLGADPKVKETNGKKYCDFSVATNKKYTTKEGEKKEETTWINVRLWGGQVAVAEKYLKKGTEVCIYNAEIKNFKYKDEKSDSDHTFTYLTGDLKLLAGSRTNTQENGNDNQGI